VKEDKAAAAATLSAMAEVHGILSGTRSPALPRADLLQIAGEDPMIELGSDGTTLRRPEVDPRKT